MNFVSPIFFIFFPLVLIFYYLVSKKYKWIVLLISSYAFYAIYNVYLTFLLIGVVLITYFCSRMIHNKIGSKKGWLSLAIILVVGSLVIFKYLDFIIGGGVSLLNLFGANISVEKIGIILPMGISFYTFQSLSYVIDVYKEKVKPEKNIFIYNLFIIYFPQLVAGPIERPSDLLPQLKDIKELKLDDVRDGLYFILVGYSFKILIADICGMFVDNIYQNYTVYSGTTIALGAILFSLQIYGDFFGYSSIAKGISRLMGIKLSDNFNKPIQATNIKDFWSRWHISLTKWFTDYIYIPLGGNRKGEARQYLNIMIVFLLSGLWHGANITFVIWGLIHGVCLVIYNIYVKHIKKEYRHIKLMNVIGFIITQFIFVFSFIYFRSETVNKANYIIGKIFSSFNFLELFSVFGTKMIFVPFIIAGSYLIYYLPKFEISEKSFFKDFKNNLIFIFYLGVAVLLVVAHVYTLNQGGGSSFIYFEF